MAKRKQPRITIDFTEAQKTSIQTYVSQLLVSAVDPIAVTKEFVEYIAEKELQENGISNGWLMTWFDKRGFKLNNNPLLLRQCLKIFIDLGLITVKRPACKGWCCSYAINADALYVTFNEDESTIANCLATQET